MNCNFADVKAAAQGRWPELLTQYGLPDELLDGRHHPCPKCGGTDRFRLIDAENGGLLCNQCFRGGDGIDALCWWTGKPAKEVARQLADHLGLSPSTNGRSRNGKARPTSNGRTRGRKATRLKIEQLAKLSPSLVGLFARDFTRAKPPIATAAIAAADGRPGQWPATAPPEKRQDVLAFLVRGPADLKPCGVLMVRRDGRAFPATAGQEGKGGGLPERKVHLLSGTQCGVVLGCSADAFRHAETVWKVEGITDLLSIVPVLPAGVAAFTSSNGAEAFPSELAEAVAGKRLYVLHDADKPGQEGAAVVARRCLGTALEVRIARLPYPITEASGKDLRDWLNDAPESQPRTYADLLALAGDSISEVAGQEEEDSGPAPVCNFEKLEGPEGQPVFRPLPINAVVASILDRCDNWPRRCGGLFMHDHYGLHWLDSPAAAFAAIQSRVGVVEWRRGSGFVTKEEVFCELKRAAAGYEAIEHLPHCPLMPGHYYATETPQPGDGKALCRLLDFFSPESEIDRDLLQSLAMTALWGGPGGTRPAFVLTADCGRGAGKSTIAAVLGHLLGGFIDISSNEDISSVKARLLSPDALPRRLVVLDNIKSHRFSWAELESLITSPTISGRRLYYGEFSRPNTLVWLLTLNGPSLSTDLSQRCVIIKLQRPQHSTSWRDTVFSFVDEHRDQIIADLIAALQAAPEEIQGASRWGTWERDVLSRLPEPSDAARVIRERREAVDVEAEESSIIEDHFEQQLADLHYSTECEVVFIPVSIAAAWWTAATGEKASTASVTRQLKQRIDEGAIKRLQPSPSRKRGRGFLWWGEQATPSSTAAYDIEDRLKYRERH